MRVVGYGKVHTKTLAGLAGAADAVLHVLFAGQAVGAHDAYRLRFEKAHAVQVPFVDQHLEQAGVVVGGRHQATAAGFQAVRVQVAGPVGPMGLLSQLAALGIPVVHLGKALVIFCRYIEAGILLVERFKNSLAQEFAECQVSKLLHDVALDVHADGVVPLFTGLGH